MVSVTGVALAAVVAGLGTASQPCPIPLEQGTSWVYEGEVSWTLENSAIVKSAQMRWISEVMKSFHIAGTCAALVRGWPDELAWFEPGHAPGLTLLAMQGNRLLRFSVSTEQEARDTVATLGRDPDKVLGRGDLILDLPLARSKRWGGDPERTDNDYCWFVEDERECPIQIKGFPATATCKSYTLVYRTRPDHEIVEFVPGLGIVRFVYEHHGTVASADMRLVEFRAPKVTLKP
jgi:hypothetical protein